MRYSIFEYSQEKLISFGLDITDALLLNWFANFFCGRMEKQIFKDENGNSKVFGWIKTSKIIEDLPVLEITSEKGIQKRLNAFVEKGLLERQILNTQKGKKSYYRTTILYESLINTSIKQNEEKKDNSAKLNHANKTESNVRTPVTMQIKQNPMKVRKVTPVTMQIKQNPMKVRKVTPVTMHKVTAVGIRKVTPVTML